MPKKYCEYSLKNKTVIHSALGMVKAQIPLRRSWLKLLNIMHNDWIKAVLS